MDNKDQETNDLGLENDNYGSEKKLENVKKKTDKIKKDDVKFADNDSVELIAIGKSTCGRWIKFQQILGEGGYKYVYKGYDTEKGFNVAWCEYKKQHVDSKEKQANMIKEIEIMVKMDHPNIVQCYDVFGDYVDSTNPSNLVNVKSIILIQELMGEGTLKSVIRKNFINGKLILKFQLVTFWLHQIVDALTYMHEKINPPIIHRDLKADNIFLESNSIDKYLNVKVGDFGLAKQMDKKENHTMLGTVGFMAPEVYDEKYDAKADIYAFGMLMLEALTNRSPYDECETVMQVAKKTMSGELPHIYKLISDPACREMIECCIHPLSVFRPTAMQLYYHPLFLNNYESESKNILPVEITPNIDKISNRETMINNFVTNILQYDEIFETNLNLRMKFRNKRIQQAFNLDEGESLEFDLDVYKETDINDLLSNLRSEYENGLKQALNPNTNADEKVINQQLDRLFKSMEMQLRYFRTIVLGKRWYYLLNNIFAKESETELNSDVTGFTLLAMYKRNWGTATKMLEGEKELYKNQKDPVEFKKISKVNKSSEIFSTEKKASHTPISQSKVVEEPHQDVKATGAGAGAEPESNSQKKFNDKKQTTDTTNADRFDSFTSYPHYAHHQNHQSHFAQKHSPHQNYPPHNNGHGSACFSSVTVQPNSSGQPCSPYGSFHSSSQFPFMYNPNWIYPFPWNPVQNMMPMMMPGGMNMMNQIHPNNLLYNPDINGNFTHPTFNNEPMLNSKNKKVEKPEKLKATQSLSDKFEVTSKSKERIYSYEEILKLISTKVERKSKNPFMIIPVEGQNQMFRVVRVHEYKNINTHDVRLPSSSRHRRLSFSGSSDLSENQLNSGSRPMFNSWFQNMPSPDMISQMSHQMNPFLYPQNGLTPFNTQPLMPQQMQQMSPQGYYWMPSPQMQPHNPHHTNHPHHMNNQPMMQPYYPPNGMMPSMFQRHPQLVPIPIGVSALSETATYGQNSDIHDVEVANRSDHIKKKTSKKAESSNSKFMVQTIPESLRYLKSNSTTSGMHDIETPYEKVRKSPKRNKQNQHQNTPLSNIMSKMGNMPIIESLTKLTATMGGFQKSVSSTIPSAPFTNDAEEESVESCRRSNYHCENYDDVVSTSSVVEFTNGIQKSPGNNINSSPVNKYHSIVFSKRFTNSLRLLSLSIKNNPRIRSKSSSNIN